MLPHRLPVSLTEPQASPASTYTLHIFMCLLVERSGAVMTLGPGGAATIKGSFGSDDSTDSFTLCGIIWPMWTSNKP